MAAPAWSEEELAWLRECYPNHLTKDLQPLMEEHGWRRSHKAIASKAKVLGLRKSDDFDSFAHMRAFTDEEMDWLRDYIPGHTEAECLDAFAKRFGRRITVSQLANRCDKLGVRHGTHASRFPKGHQMNKGRSWDEQGIPKETQERLRKGFFKKGNVPHNQGCLLDERVGTDGYVMVKVNPRDAKNTMDYWIGKGRFVWMQANGRDWPEGHVCVFADRDNRNFDPDNIVAVPKDIYPMVSGMVKGQIEYFNRESLEVAIANALVTRKRLELKRREKELRRGGDA